MLRRVTLFGPLKDDFGKRELQIEAGGDETVRSILERLEIQPDIVKVALDGEICELDTQLSDSIEIAILPPVSGG